MSTTYRPHSTKTTSWTCAPCTVRPDPAVRNWTRRYDAAGIPDIAGTGWAAAACAFLVAGLFTWTNMRENADAPDSNPIAQLMAPSESGTDQDRPPPPSPPPLSPRKRRPCNARAARAGVRIAATTGRPAAEASAPGAAQPEAAAQEPAQAQAALSDEEIESRLAHIRSLMQDDQQEDAAHALQELRQAVPDLTVPDDLQELAQQHPA